MTKFPFTIEIISVCRTAVAGHVVTNNLIYANEEDALAVYDEVKVPCSPNGAPIPLDLRDALGALALDRRDVMSVRLYSNETLAEARFEEIGRQGVRDGVYEATKGEAKRQAMHDEAKAKGAAPRSFPPDR